MCKQFSNILQKPRLDNFENINELKNKTRGAT